MMNLLPISEAVRKLFPKASARTLARAALDGKKVGRKFTLVIDLDEGTTMVRIDGAEIDLHVAKTTTYTGIGKAYIHLEELV